MTVSLVFIPCGLAAMFISASKYFAPVTGLVIFTRHESDDELLDRGIHRIIRHPLYAGTLLLIWGLFLLFPFTSNLCSCIIITLYTFVGIRLEEKKLLLRFGETYRVYCQRVPMMIPKIPLKKIRIGSSTHR